MKKKRDILYFWMPVILSVLLAILQLLPVPTKQELLLYDAYWRLQSCSVANNEDDNSDTNYTALNYDMSHNNFKILLQVCVWMWRLPIAIILAVAIVVLTALAFYFDNSRERWLRIFLQTSIKEFFPNPGGGERCTIFLKGGGWRFSISYLYKVIFACGRQHINEKTFWLHIKRTPSPFKKYLTMYVRANAPYPDGTSTYFNICKTGKESYGVVSFCAFHKIAKLVETKQISTFYKPYSSSRGNAAVLNEYLSACLLSREQLKCIHQYANHIYAVPITDVYELETIAVMVVDIDSAEEKCFNKELQDRLGYIARIVGTVMRNDY